MVLPPSHLDTLAQHMNLHRQRIAQLRQLLDKLNQQIARRQASQGSDPKPEGIPGLVAEAELYEREIRSHEKLLALGQDEHLLNTLSELLDNPKLAQAATRDPRGYARDRGIELPTNMNLTMSIRNGRIEILIAYYDELAPFLITWNNDGFSPPPGQHEPTPQPA